MDGFSEGYRRRAARSAAQLHAEKAAAVARTAAVESLRMVRQRPRPGAQVPQQRDPVD